MVAARKAVRTKKGCERKGLLELWDGMRRGFFFDGDKVSSSVFFRCIIYFNI